MQLAVSVPSLYLPGAAGVHKSLEAKPTLSPVRPAGQALQPEAEAMPCALLYLAIGQAEQLLASDVYNVCPVAFDDPYFPAGQGLHDVCPS